MDDDTSLVWRMLNALDEQERALLEFVHMTGALPGEVDTVTRIDRRPECGWGNSMRIDLN